MPTVVDAALFPRGRGEQWRHCEICDELAAMAPQATLCDACAEVVTPMAGLRLVHEVDHAGRGWSR
ncbi:hypothetical protein WEI85_34920 [Actinomycetes bacterium KLBMP 9797]